MYGFDAIHSHERAKAFLKRAANRRGGAFYIIHGPALCGKTLLAKTFAKAALCQSENAAACGKCLSCRAFDAENHPDFIVLEGDSEKNTVSVDTARDCLDMIFKRPVLSAKKIFLFERAGSLTAAAQNALLKVLEEPPAYACVIFTSPDKNFSLLPAVRSRAVALRLAPLTDADVFDYLTKKAGFSPQTACKLIPAAFGSIGFALKYKDAADIIDDLTQAAYALVLSASFHEDTYALKRVIENGKEYAALFLKILCGLIRDALLIKTGGGAPRWRRDELREAARVFDADALLEKFFNAYNILTNLTAQKYAVSAVSVIETLFYI